MLVVSGPDGRELFRSSGALRAEPFQPEPGRPPGSDLFAEGNTMFARFSIPVRAGGPDPRFFLTIELPAPVLISVVSTLAVPSGWIGALIDSNGLVISRTFDPDRFVGKLATPDFRANAHGDEGSWRGSTLGGETVVVGYARMHLASWRFAVGAPVSLVEAPLRRALFLLAGGGLLLALLSVLLASSLARRIARPLHDLAGAGAVLSRGEVLPPVPTGVREVAFVASALRTASVALRNRTDALDAERSRLAAIIETVPVGLLIVTPEMEVLSSNAQMAEIMGRPLGPGPAMLDLRMADNSPVPPEVLPTARAIAGEANPELECRLRRWNGSEVWVYLIAAPIRAAPLRDGAGAVTAAVVAALDIEELVRARDEKARSALELERQVAERTGELERTNARLRDEMRSRADVEAQLRQVQKMEAVGQLTGGIAHDFNNLLTVVVGCLDMLSRRITEERAHRLLDNAQDAAGGAAPRPARLRAVSRQQPLAPRALDLNALVEGMADLLRRTLGEPVDLVTVLDPALWPVHADPNQVENVLLNLVVNAKDAIVAAGSGSGRLTVSTANVALPAGRFVDVAGGDYVQLAVSDTGAGMKEDVINRAFEPFFTTKPVGQGTGLGLSQVHGFVKQSGGHVEIASRTLPDRSHGTTVTIFLPREPVPGTGSAPPENLRPILALVPDRQPDPGPERPPDA